MQEQSVAKLRVGDIVPNPANPRQKFSPNTMDDFNQSVKAKGVHTAITVRTTTDGKHMIIAGERRWRAARLMHGEDYMIPAVIREASTDDDALEVAISENVDREAMSPVEEAEAVDKLATKHGGNLDEVARRMGWKLPKVKQRLALMRAVPEVRKALLSEEITLGHAELLAAAPEAMQVKALPKIIADKWSLEAVKEALLRRTHVLATAIFDKTECENCPSNTGLQKTLFTTALDAGRCTNAPCFDAKTEAAIAAQAEMLKETYPRVEILRIDNKVPVTTLETEGARGVGTEQAKACRACKDFGATVSAIPGSLGTMTPSQCFDLTCNAEKRQAFVDANKPAPVETPLVKPDDGVAAKPPEQGTAPAKPTSTKATGNSPAPKMDAKSLRSAITDHRRAIWQDALQRIALKEHPVGARLLVILATTGELRSLDADKYDEALCKALGVKQISKGKKDPGGGAKVMEADDASIAKFLAGIVAASAHSISPDVLEQLLASSGKTLESFWKVDKAFLDVLTKSEIDVVAKEVGAAAHMGDTYRSLLNKKKDEFVAAVLESGFDFTGKVPSFMKWRS